MLGLLSLRLGIGVRENKDAMMPGYNASFTPCVAGQAGVADWVYVARAYPLADFKASYGLRLGP
jgi:hypothetical protein